MNLTAEIQKLQNYLRIKDFGFSNIKIIKVELEVHDKDIFMNEVLNYT